MDTLVADLLHTTSYALSRQQGDATGMWASLQILHRRLLRAAQEAPQPAPDVETWHGGTATVQVIPR